MTAIAALDRIFSTLAACLATSLSVPSFPTRDAERPLPIGLYTVSYLASGDGITFIQLSCYWQAAVIGCPLIFPEQR